MNRSELKNPSYITKAQHVCLKKGGADAVEQSAPFKAVNKPPEVENGDIKYRQFLGEGYYFWDDNEQMAHIWGNHRCEGTYFITETEIYIGIDWCFDLVGCRPHLKLLKHAIEKYESDRKRKVCIGECIELLKQIKSEKDESFQFKIIRAVDDYVTDNYNPSTVNFVENFKHTMKLDPKISLCVIDKIVLLRPISITYSSKN